MPITDDGAPQLSVPAADPIGRLYRLPGSAPLKTNAQGDIVLPTKATIKKNIVSGEYAPSITNVIGVRSAPHLMKWAAKKAAQCAIDTERTHPGLMRSKPLEAEKYFTAAAERDRDAAAEQGTFIHLMCENISRGIELPELTPLQQAYVNAYRRFLQDFSPTFIAIEATVFGVTSDNLTYAGTTDFIAHIGGKNFVCDIKTTRSGLHANIALQLSAVSHAQTLVNDDAVSTTNMPEIHGALGLHLSPQGYTVAPVRIDEEIWKTFESLRRAWNFHVLDGHLPSGDSVEKAVLNPAQLLAALGA